MMVPKKSLLLAGAALALFGATASAQSGKIHKTLSNKSLRTATLDLASGTVTRGPVVNNRVGGTIQDFANGDNRAIGVDTGSGFCEWYTVGVKGFTGNASDLMANFRMSYCTSWADPLSGGPGGTTKLGFYNGYTLTGPLPTLAQTVAAFTLTGLPGNTGTNCFIPWAASATGCLSLTIGFATPICFPDGAIAYSWKFVDMDSCGPWSHTFPILACVSSCSHNFIGTTYPTGAYPPDGQGMTDFMDQYCPPGTLLKTFTFNTSAGLYQMFTSQSMRIREVKDCPATIAGYNNSTAPLNTDGFTATPAILGSTWTGTTTRVGGTNGFYRLRINNAKQAGNGLKCSSFFTPPVATATGRNMLAGVQQALFTGSIIGTTGVAASAIPCDPALLGFYWTAQSAIVFGTTGRRCTSAVEGTVGTL